METGYIPEVVQVVPGEGYTVFAYFDDGSIHLYDVAPLVKDGTVFAPLKDLEFFRLNHFSCGIRVASLVNVGSCR
ncbi:DUF2442 domain-containing protein [uncultured Selenomonas sp.]|uniref:DUF2442 domain-containing protein n=1 Tax=uncultured Selenomonas sp. TaxID=159275 RepID=UPI0025D9F573|nr:DUF2442 domain-containing protein [uncultured Selenomonas sp.]